uniref:Fatty-acid amide hydrolase 1 n=1 Tax=Nothobranchius pienaari TaxID=704102 RepID=A0A1A8LFP1_9TELE
MEEFLQTVSVDKRTASLLTTAACGLGALLVLVRSVSSRRAAKEKIQRARTRRTESLHRAEQAVLRYRQSHPSTDSALILSLSLSELTKRLQEDSLSPEEVFYSYVEKTLNVHKKLNCCTEILLESLDELKTIGSKKKGLLYGVPISIKDNIAYKDHDCTCGVVINLEQPAQGDSVIVKVLKKQGAIPFVKTNLPQALLSYDCSNPIYGQTLNPCNPQKTSGGSSGGEGALIGGGGSILGIGSDIGGSIRIPASFCGICGFKPTAVLSATGPMAKDVDSLVLCMQALLCDHMFSLDPTVPPVPFNVQLYESSKPLRIGYLESDGYSQPTPSMARGIREVKALLEQAGHTLVPYQPLRVNKIMTELVFKGIFADGATSMVQKLKGGPIDPCLRDQVNLYALPKWLKRIIGFLLKPFSPRFPFILDAVSGLKSIPDLWKQHAAVEDYISETITHWRSCNIDVVLCPVVGPAYNFTYCGQISTILSYTALYNLLNFPAGVVPVSTVTADDEEELKHYKGVFQDKMDKLLKKAVTGAEGLPVAVQCVALPWQDEVCLRFMKEVEHLVKQKRK